MSYKERILRGLERLDAAERRARLREIEERDGRRAREEAENEALLEEERRARREEEERRARLKREEEVCRARQQREEELAMIARAREVQAERKHHAELAWAKRVLEEGDADPAAGRTAIPRAVRHSVWIRDGGRCVDCGSKEGLEYDHVIPFTMGGSNTERNLQLLCERCNRRKGKTVG